MTTITIKETNHPWLKRSFDDAGDLLDYLLEHYEIGKLKRLPVKELTEQRKLDWQEVEDMDNNDFIDIR